jgi:hypothetical protein
MNKLDQMNTASRGLRRLATIFAGISSLVMIAGSANALSIDLSGYRGGDAEISAGDHTVSISESRSRRGRSVSITINGGERFAVNTITAALRGRHGVVAAIGGNRETVGRISDRRGHAFGLADFEGAEGGELVLSSRDRIRIGTIDIDVPNRPAPVTAVPEPGAALLFGAGIVLAGLRRR